MSQENVEIVRRMYEAFHAGDAEGALAYFDPEVCSWVSKHCGRAKGSGIEVETRYAVLYEIHGDKITRMAIYSEPAEALDAAGLSE